MDAREMVKALERESALPVTRSRAHVFTRTTLDANGVRTKVHEESSKEAAMEMCIAQHAPASPACTHASQIEREAAFVALRPQFRMTEHAEYHGLSDRSDQRFRSRRRAVHATMVVQLPVRVL
jgi:hypothetical protein